MRIGIFARIGQVTVRTLRLYDEIGLLKPCAVEPFTGYRIYEAAQLATLNRILALKELGLTLDEIATALRRPLSVDDLRAMLDRQRRRVMEETERLMRVEARLRLIEQEAFMSEVSVVIKRVDEMLVAGIRETIPTQEQVSTVLDRNFGELFGYVGSNGGKIVGASLDYWHDLEFTGVNMDVEAMVPIAAPIPTSERVQVHTVPAVESMATTIHKGSYATLSQSFAPFTEWIRANGYEIVGPNREVYLDHRPDAPSECVTEIQFPVAKR